jgi:glutamine amidotransferase
LIAVINLGNSNITSIINALEHLSIDYKITEDKEDLINCEKILLPGVGTFGNGVKQLKNLNLFDTLKDEVLNKKKPILGICLGMQLLFDSSEESMGVDGLSLLKGSVIKLPTSSTYSIPRIGWASSTLNFDFLSLKKDEQIDFYYIHTFYVKPEDDSIISISTDNNITSAINFENIYGCQFHPEKSHIKGLNILEAFAKEI